MKIAANYTIFYGEEFLEFSVRSIYDFVDRINIAVGEKSWKNHKGVRFDPIDNTLELVDRLPDPKNKIRVFKGIWDSDTEQRNFLLDKCIGKYDYAMLIDSDEVWEKAQISGLLEFATNDLERSPKGEESKVISVNIIHYFKSLYYGFRGELQKVNYLFRTDGSIHHEWIRHAGTVKTAHCSCYYHHYGYAYPKEIIQKKIRMWGHSHEVTENWYKDIYLGWQPGKLQAWSPTGDLWEPIKMYGLIPEMAGHRLSEKDWYD